MPWISSASARFRPPATLTSSPSVYCGFTLRARSCASVTGPSPAAPTYTSGMPSSGQKRSVSGKRRAQVGQASGSAAIQLHLVDIAAADGEGPDHRLIRVLERADQVKALGQAGGLVDVGLRGVGLAARVRVVEGEHLLPTLVGELVDP